MQNLELLSDGILYKEFLNGNKMAFEEIVLRYKNNMIYFISRYTKNIEIAEDISQDVFVYLLINKEKYDSNYSLKTYLYMIAKCRAMNYLKKENKNIKLDEYKNFVDASSIEDQLFAEEMSSNMRKMINKLKPEYQSALYLADFENLSYKEISKIMNKSLGQVKTLIYNARQALKKLLEKEGFSYDG